MPVCSDWESAPCDSRTCQLPTDAPFPQPPETRPSLPRQNAVASRQGRRRRDGRQLILRGADDRVQRGDCEGRPVPAEYGLGDPPETVHADFVTSAAHCFDLDHDQLRELSKMLYAAIFEDFLTVRFGRRGQLNVIDDYLRQDGRREPAYCSRYLEAARDSTPSLYEVVNIDPGRSVTVRDLLFGGEPVTVLDHLGSQALAPWDRVAARVLAPGYWGVSCCLTHWQGPGLHCRSCAKAAMRRWSLARCVFRSSETRRGSQPCWTESSHSNGSTAVMDTGHDPLQDSRPRRFQGVRDGMWS